MDCRLKVRRWTVTPEMEVRFLPSQPKDKQMKDYWNRCDACGKFVSIESFENSTAVRRLVYPDSLYTREVTECLCAVCWEKEKERRVAM